MSAMDKFFGNEEAVWRFDFSYYSEDVFNKCNKKLLSDIFFEAIVFKHYNVVEDMFRNQIINVEMEIHVPSWKRGCSGFLMVRQQISDDMFSTNVRSLLMSHKDINLLRILAKYDSITFEDQNFIFGSIYLPEVFELNCINLSKEFKKNGNNLNNISNFPMYLCGTRDENFLFILQFCELTENPIDLKKSHVHGTDLLTIVEFAILHRPHLLNQIGKCGITKTDILKKGYLPNIMGRFSEKINSSLSLLTA